MLTDLFNVTITDLHKCKGPKRVDCFDWQFKVVDGTFVTVNFTANDTIGDFRGYMAAKVNGKQVWRMKTDSFCKQPFLKLIFKTFINMTDNCEIMPGEYISSLDVTTAMRNYTGGHFFLGNATFKTIFYNSQCNFICSVTSFWLR